MTSAPIAASQRPVCGPLMIQLKSVTRIPSSGRRPIASSPSSDHAYGAKTRELRARVSEPLAQNLFVMLAEQRRAARHDRRRGQPHQRPGIAQAAGNRMVYLHEGVARAQMRMLGGLSD